MRNTKAFKAAVRGSLYSIPVMNYAGGYVFDLSEACQQLESDYDGDWQEAYNGNDGISREEWLEQ